MKTSELTGAQLDYWVAKALGYRSVTDVPEAVLGFWYAGESDGGPQAWAPSTNWHQAGPIIARFNIVMWPAEGDLGEYAHALGEMDAGDRTGWLDLGPGHDLVILGETKLIAAMRAFVRMRFGEDLPDDAG